MSLFYSAQVSLYLVSGLVGLVYPLLEGLVHRIELIPHVLRRLLEHIVRHVHVLVRLSALARRSSDVVLGELGPRLWRRNTIIT